LPKQKKTKLYKYKDQKVDLVYSIICHEAPDCVIDLCEHQENSQRIESSHYPKHQSHSFRARRPIHSCRICTGALIAKMLS